MNYKDFKKPVRGCRVGSTANSISCSSGEPGFEFQNLYGDSQLSANAIPGALLPSSGLCKYQKNKWHTDIIAGKTPIHINFFKYQ